MQPEKYVKGVLWFVTVIQLLICKFMNMGIGFRVDKIMLLSILFLLVRERQMNGEFASF